VYSPPTFCRTIGCSDRESSPGISSIGDSPCCRQQFRAAINLQNRQRTSGVPCRRARSASVSKQLNYELLLSNPLRLVRNAPCAAPATARPRVAHAHSTSDRRSPAKNKFVRLPSGTAPLALKFTIASGCCVSFVCNHHAHRRRQSQILQYRTSARFKSTSPPNFIRFRPSPSGPSKKHGPVARAQVFAPTVAKFRANSGGRTGRSNHGQRTRSHANAVPIRSPAVFQHSRAASAAGNL